jgi:two-component system sensor histidine kinase GlrK
MRALVAAIIEDYRIRLRTKSISLKEALRPVEVDGNPEQLRTIVDNLLSNAVKYSPNGGEIRIGLRQAGGNMELEIEDDGPGIEPDERSHVFEPFFQGRATQAGGVVGTGLGLAIVSECVVGHRGKVDALEPRPDKHGARIRVSIPLRIDIDK